ncbi:MAG: adenosylcobinamide amidohydrolase [Hamadaea sp.]|uniref:adenosylcobinamide amidohydrolase n=1 Tax=Hamadaea sp. TaxID=2024425 RepID=UPI0017ECB00D|nr:adenosylcobinamide amidohydrolase [Hamadaea sp.]NUR73215.1 adenosylcobinamide amidohydrolase [Hamadaea sp.]NUT19474.1 adenosylcobinamide amidohydrolase [Hamadaea sp.]
MRPELVFREEGGLSAPLLVWRLPGAIPTISSGPLGGGIGRHRWVMNTTVPMSYDRDDPGIHLTDIAAEIGLTGPGVGLMTGVDVQRVVQASDDGVEVFATVGLGRPVLAAAPAEDLGELVGTVNIICFLPARLSEAALVNSVATVTEAKAQALFELGYAATGTATDAVCVVVSDSGPLEPYGGPRSRWGAPLARAVHQAVLRGGRDFRAAPTAWLD